MHGIPVPELYWYGHEIAKLPIDKLPEHVVIRPTWGAGGLETFVMSGDRELFSLQTIPRSELVGRLLEKYGRLARFPILAEEFLTNEDGVYERGVEYRFYVFGDRVGLIQQILHTGQVGLKTAYYPDWTVFQDQNGKEDAFNFKRQGPLNRPRPAQPDTMLEIARTLGTAYGTFVRVDLYLTHKRCYFGEFASVPYGGKGFTPGADAYLGRLWEETFPDRT